MTEPVRNDDGPDTRLLVKIAQDAAAKAVAEALATGGGGPHDPGMDALIRRVDQLEGDVKGIKGTLERLEPMIVRIDERLNAVCTKEDLGKVAERVAKIEGAVEKLPTTLHLLGFVVAVLGLAGLAKYFSP